MLETFYPGETMRITARDLTHTANGSITADALVTVEVLNPDGTEYDSGMAATGGSGDDWYLDMAAPPDPGSYTVKMTAVVGGATWMGRDQIRVVPF